MSQGQWQQQVAQWERLEEEEQRRQLHNAAVLDKVIYAMCLLMLAILLFGTGGL